MKTLLRVGAEVMTPVCEYTGLSTDSKPASAPNASSFFEFDTGKIFFYDADSSSWIELAPAPEAQEEEET